MRLILDTHTLIWSVDDPSKVSSAAMTAMTDPANERFISAATIWELAIKVGQGKLTLSLPYREWIERAIDDLDLAILPITVKYGERQAQLPDHHRDPFDRLIVAQALVDQFRVVSIDAQLDAYGIDRIW